MKQTTGCLPSPAGAYMIRQTEHIFGNSYNIWQVVDEVLS